MLTQVRRSLAGSLGTRRHLKCNSRISYLAASSRDARSAAPQAVASAVPAAQPSGKILSTPESLDSVEDALLGRADPAAWSLQQPEMGPRVENVPTAGDDGGRQQFECCSLTEQLLRLRREAVREKAEGIVKFCDTFLEQRCMMMILNVQLCSAAGLASVIECYHVRHLLPDPAEEPQALHAVMDACRWQLLVHSRFGKFVGPVPPGTPSLGDLLGWAFGDAPSVLSDPEVLWQMQELSAAAMEALLCSDTFATDSESSVLLLLATWLQANPTTPEDVRERLCGLVRLSHLNSAYLHLILPTLDWFPITLEEHRFLCLYVSATEAHRSRLAKEAAVIYDTSSPWYSASARPSPTAPRKFEWDLGALAEQLAAADARPDVEGITVDYDTFATSHGIGLCLSVTFRKEDNQVVPTVTYGLPLVLFSSKTGPMLGVAPKEDFQICYGSSSSGGGGGTGEARTIKLDSSYSVSVITGSGKSSGEVRRPLAAWSKTRISLVLDWS